MILVIPLLVLALQQDVVVAFEDGRWAEGVFHATLRLTEAGDASGTVQLRHMDPEDSEIVVFVVMHFSEGEVVETDEGLMILAVGEGMIRPGDRGRPVRDAFAVQIGPWDPTSEDDPIWQFHSGNVYDGAFFPAITRLVEPAPRGPDRRPER